ncbi:MAG: hypothetical protein JWQ76_4737 [Ramlibacter sp.]|nr:hypothetical protein [Ramlibacter sp.]
MNFSNAELQALHGAPGFAETCPLTEAAYLGRPVRGTKLFRCGCAGGRLWRKKRRLWMRLLPFLKLYECEKCGTRVLATNIPMRRVQPVYLPSAAFTQFLNIRASRATFDAIQQRYRRP